MFSSIAKLIYFISKKGMKEFYFTPFCFGLNQHLEDNRNENSQKKEQKQKTVTYRTNKMNSH